LDEYFKTGTVIEGRVSEQLLRNIFFPKAALHDGAVIINGDRVVAAGCVLPLSESVRLHADLGTRHRAGVGMSEVSDAVVVIVSEETGTISVAVGGMLKRHLAPQTLERLLHKELVVEEPELDKSPAARVKKLLNGLTKEGSGNE
jgi:diadenylate cyclase